jgi:hypothetical protein
MKSDALISYQSPFNLLAFAILWPASFVLTPRALHTANVFLLRLTVRSVPGITRNIGANLNHSRSPFS